MKNWQRIFEACDEEQKMEIIITDISKLVDTWTKCRAKPTNTYLMSYKGVLDAKREYNSCRSVILEEIGELTKESVRQDLTNIIMTAFPPYTI